MTCRPILIKHLFSQMEAKVKGTLNYHGNLSDFPASEGDDTLGWLLEPTWWESTRVVIGLLFCRCLHSLVPSTVVRRKKKRKHYLSKARCRSLLGVQWRWEERKLIRVVFCEFPLLFWSLVVHCILMGGKPLRAQPLPFWKQFHLLPGWLGLPGSGVWWESFEQLSESELCILGLTWVRWACCKSLSVLARLIFFLLCNRGEMHIIEIGMTWWLRLYRICLQCRRHGFDPCVKKIPWRKEWQPTPVFLPRESPWTEDPGRLQSMGLQRVGHDWATRPSTYEIFQTWHKAILTESQRCIMWFTWVSE